MDSYLLDYLRSGKAWVLVGSGPSSEMGYPSWEKLARSALDLVKIEGTDYSSPNITQAYQQKNYPRVFEEAKKALGGPRLLEALRRDFRPTRSGRIYELISRWPVAVYMTTNFDDEIHSHLSAVSETYLPYSNSPDHMALLPDFSGAIIKLHGDLTSENGLILTSTQYHNIANGSEWLYWRTKLTSIFQMNPVVIIGYSLTDEHIKHVLEAAKHGSGVIQPVCWIAPDVSHETVKEYLETYRIRVISFDNKDGSYKNLTRLIESISNFIPPRTSIKIQHDIAQISKSPLGTNAAAPGFFVYSKLSSQENFENIRIEVVIAALLSIIPQLSTKGEFTLNEALELLGWPISEVPLPSDLKNQILERALGQGLLSKKMDKLIVGDQASKIDQESYQRFSHLRDRFKQSLYLRIKRNFTAVDDKRANQIAADIEASLTGYFRNGGLSLATLLFANRHLSKTNTAPYSIVKFITEASAQYDNLLERQIFWSESVDTFVRAEAAEREYLGRIAQGFFAFHALGLFGDAAKEIMKQAGETVWLTDSNIQILALSVPAPTSLAFRECISRSKELGIRFFTTEKLFDETYIHFWFADQVIRNCGDPASHYVLAAATGQAPYYKSNQFLAGFIAWQAGGNPCDWQDYLNTIFESRLPTKADIKSAVKKMGIEIVPFDNWPGFLENHFSSRDEFVAKIIQTPSRTHDTNIGINEWSQYRELDFPIDPHKKAEPEAEALVIVINEREGVYYVLSEPGKKSPAWFISSTSLLNTLENKRVTWQPEAFLRFASTLAPSVNHHSAERAFETILWGIAQSGLSVLDEKLVTTVFGGIIDQASISDDGTRQMYEDTLALKYGESHESVLARISPINRPMAAIQLANEMAQVESIRRKQASSAAEAAQTRAYKAEQEVSKLQKYRHKLNQKQEDQKRRSKRRQSSRAKKGNKGK